MSARRSQGLRIGAAAALALVGFAASFGVARLTRDDAGSTERADAGQASVVVLPPEAARLVRLSPGGAVPALRAAPTTAIVAQPAPVQTAAPSPQPEPEPTPAPEPTTYIP